MGACQDVCCCTLQDLPMAFKDCKGIPRAGSLAVAAMAASASRAIAGLHVELRDFGFRAVAGSARVFSPTVSCRLCMPVSVATEKPHDAAATLHPKTLKLLGDSCEATVGCMSPALVLSDLRGTSQISTACASG